MCRLSRERSLSSVQTAMIARESNVRNEKSQALYWVSAQKARPYLLKGPPTEYANSSEKTGPPKELPA